MRKITIFYWICTVLILSMMLFSALQEIINGKQAVDFITHLGYPAYLNPFLGVAKILGAIAILVPGFPRIKEWAYAGFFIDLTGATYTFAATGQSAGSYVFMLVLYALLFGSYFLYHKRLSVKTA